MTNRRIPWPVHCLVLAASVGTPTTACTEGDVASPADEAFLSELAAVDRRAAEIRDLTAAFEEHKYTALLKEPLNSKGRIRVVGSTVRWETRRPHHTQTLLDGSHLRIHYPKRKTVEVYPLDERLDQLFASPIPRLSHLRSQFKIERLSPSEVDKAYRDADHYLPVRLTASDASLQRYIDRVDVVIERTSGCAVWVEMVDADGERTVLTFSDMATNSGLTARDVELDLPAGTHVVYPLSGDGHSTSDSQPEDLP